MADAKRSKCGTYVFPDSGLGHFPTKGDATMASMKQQASKQPPKTPDLKSGLPGTPEERRRRIREAMEQHAETLRRLAER
jgi:hypothetical protein